MARNVAGREVKYREFVGREVGYFIEMELLLVNPLGLNYPLDLVVRKFCQQPLLQTALNEFLVSSDCVDFAFAFQSQLKCPFWVNYLWDEQHSATKQEPAHIDAGYVNEDWIVEETYDQFALRVCTEAQNLKKRKRVVLCSPAVIRVISGLEGLSMCKFKVEPGNIQATDQVYTEDITHWFASERIVILKQQNNTKAQAIATALTPILAQFTGQIHSNSTAFLPLLTRILTEEITAAVDDLERLYDQTAAAVVTELQRKCESYTSKIAGLNAVIRELEAGQQASLAVVQTFEQEMRVGGAVEPRIADLKRTIAQFGSRMEKLYEEIPDQKVKKQPLKLIISESGQCSVENRKPYPLESLELFCSAENQTLNLLEFTAPPGLSEYQVPFPSLPAQVLTFVIKQKDQEVCRPIQLVSQSSVKPPAVGAKPGAEFKSGTPGNFSTVPIPKSGVAAPGGFPPVKGGAVPANSAFSGAAKPGLPNPMAVRDPKPEAVGTSPNFRYQGDAKLKHPSPNN